MAVVVEVQAMCEVDKHRHRPAAIVWPLVAHLDHGRASWAEEEVRKASAMDAHDDGRHREEAHLQVKPGQVKSSQVKSSQVPH